MESFRSSGFEDEFTEWKEKTERQVAVDINAWKQEAYEDVDKYLEQHATQWDNGLANANKQIGFLSNYVTPEMFGAKGDGVTDDTEALKRTIADNRIIDLRGKSYVVSEGLELGAIIRNGTIIYTGSANQPIFKLLDCGGLNNINVIIKTSNYASDVVLIDYTMYDAQFNPMTFMLDGLKIDNTASKTFVAGSACVHFVYDKYKVLVNQNINNIKLSGRMYYGIYVEPKLRNESDNPVFNTCVFSNIWFATVNCALYACPTMESGTLEKAQGALKITLINFANQHVDGIDRAFLDIHNTEIEGTGVIPWDYYGDKIPECGTYKTDNSAVILDFMHFGENTNENVFYQYRKVMKNEAYSYQPPLKMTEIDADFNPLRSTGMNGAMERVRFISTIPNDEKYNVKHYGILFQSRNDNDPAGNLISQLLLRATNNRITLWMRKFFPETGTWGDRQQVYGEGSVPKSWEGNRPDGLDVGDMKFDTAIKKPVWWNGTEWVLADGTAI